MTEQIALPALNPVDRACFIEGVEARRGGIVDEICDVPLAEEYL
jgi:hypothetical protein